MSHESEFLKEYTLFLREEGELERAKHLLYHYLRHEPGDIGIQFVLADTEEGQETTTFTSLSEKRKFSTWLMNTAPSGGREALWILNYLLTHDAILNDVHFIENIGKTDRGARVVADGLGRESLLLFVRAQEFTDSEQIFHEIRMNWRRTLHSECVSPEAWQTSQYLSVLEGDPLAPWDEQAGQEVVRAIGQYFKQEEQMQRMVLPKAQIDDTLEIGNREAFLESSDGLNCLKQ